ncbi:MAG TPA: 50S ribosomal protein L33 [Dehalococcoidales bacterium]|nr:MAG: 50S ribosomal protein L33 [Dehalococcoidia bacterium]HUU08502.1 50S ribosomal protein L33 [Dehalococcoidales bacterium]
MAKKAEARIIISLACTECGERTYTTTKNKKNDPQRLELKKYCPRCRAQKLHREVK